MSLYNECICVKNAKRKLSVLDGETKKKILFDFADALRKNANKIIAQNEKDINNAIDMGIRKTMIDRLMLNGDRIEEMAKGVEDVANLADPIGVIIEQRDLYNNLHLKKVTVPIGVIGIIYEARPNVTSDSIALCFKSGNAVILKGGKEAILSNEIITSLMKESLRKFNVDENCVFLINKTDRESTNEMMRLNKIIDVLIPRGSKSLINAVVNQATVPVIQTGAGNCHLYVDEKCNINMALNILDNGKTQRPSVCNALETLLVNEKIAKEFLPLAHKRLAEKGVEFRCDNASAEILKIGIKEACEEDFYEEYDDLILAIKVVKNVKEAVEHIEKYSTHHSEAIVTDIEENAEYFTKNIDSAAVYVNASTRFTDGAQFGLGAEIGISTQKLHARGPMGLNELTSYKYIINGNGQIRK